MELLVHWMKHSFTSGTRSTRPEHFRNPDFMLTQLQMIYLTNVNAIERSWVTLNLCRTACALNEAFISVRNLTYQTRRVRNHDFTLTQLQKIHLTNGYWKINKLSWVTLNLCRTACALNEAFISVRNLTYQTRRVRNHDFTLTQLQKIHLTNGYWKINKLSWVTLNLSRTACALNEAFIHVTNLIYQ